MGFLKGLDRDDVGKKRILGWVLYLGTIYRCIDNRCVCVCIYVYVSIYLYIYIHGYVGAMYTVKIWSFTSSLNRGGFQNGRGGACGSPITRIVTFWNL